MTSENKHPVNISQSTAFKNCLVGMPIRHTKAPSTVSYLGEAIGIPDCGKKEVCNLIIHTRIACDGPPLILILIPGDYQGARHRHLSLKERMTRALKIPTIHRAVNGRDESAGKEWTRSFVFA